MDVKIADKDIVITTWGDTVYVDSIDEILQRVNIACTVKKGFFPFDRKLGSCAHLLNPDEPMLKEKLEMIYKEATVDVPYSDLRVLSIDDTKAQKTALVEVVCGKKSATTEVTIYE